MIKLMLCNIGWSDHYDGALLKDDQKFLTRHKGDGSEDGTLKRFRVAAFMDTSAGMGGKSHSPPQLANKNTGWTLFFYAKDAVSDSIGMPPSALIGERI